MTALENQPSPKRRLLLASDRIDRSSELAGNLQSPESVQLIRNKLRAEAYRSMPRLFVLSDALHHGSMQAWALGATDTISRPFDAAGILQRIHAAFPDSQGFDATERGKALNRGIAAAHGVM